MMIINYEISIPDRSEPRLTTTTSSGVGYQGAGGSYVTIDRRQRKSRGGRRVQRQREKERQECGDESRDFKCRDYNWLRKRAG